MGWWLLDILLSVDLAGAYIAPRLLRRLNLPLHGPVFLKDKLDFNRKRKEMAQTKAAVGKKLGGYCDMCSRRRCQLDRPNFIQI